MEDLLETEDMETLVESEVDTDAIDTDAIDEDISLGIIIAE